MKKGIIVMAMTMMLLVSAIALGAAASPQNATDENHGMHGHEYGELGAFNYTAGTATGKFVDFKINPENGAISDYSVNGSAVFSSVSYENTTQGSVSVHGATLMYMGFGAKLNWSKQNWSNPGSMFKTSWTMVSAHDAPAGVLHIVQFGENKIIYTLAQGENAKITGNHTISVSGAVSGMIIHTGTAKISGNSIYITLGINEFDFGNMKMRGGSALFISNYAWHFGQELRNKVMNAIAQGKVGGEMMVHGQNSEFMNYTYGFHAQIQAQEKNKVSVKVSSEEHEGKVVIMDINKSSMQYDSQHKIIVKIDGKEIKMTDDNSVFAGGTEGKYAVVDNGNYVTVMVYIPHFSEHSVDVESQPNALGEITANPLLIGAVAAAVILVIVAAIIVVKRH